MNIDRKVVEQVLEALKANDLLVNGDDKSGGLVFCMDGYYSGSFDIESVNKQTDEAITAIRLALEQPAQQEPFGYFRYDLRLDAWVQNRAGLTGTPFYTRPKAREWVGLTDEERSYYLQSASNVGWWQASLFIEAKLKEKNT